MKKMYQAISQIEVSEGRDNKEAGKGNTESRLYNNSSHLCTGIMKKTCMKEKKMLATRTI